MAGCVWKGGEVMRVLVTSHLTIEVVNQGRGQWRVTRQLSYGQEITGYNGEQCLYVFITSWQSGHNHCCVVLCKVDGRTETVTGLYTRHNITNGINNLIEIVGVKE